MISVLATECPHASQVLALFEGRSSKYDDDNSFHPRLAAGWLPFTSNVGVTLFS